MKRRNFLQNLLASASITTLPTLGYVNAANHSSNVGRLVCLSPSHRVGALSQCQASVWYVQLERDIYVCMGTGSSHVQAALKGSRHTKLSFTDSEPLLSDSEHDLLSIDAMATIETDQRKIKAVLMEFSQKYHEEWHKHSDVYKNGLAKGLRTLLRYQLAPV